MNADLIVDSDNDLKYLVLDESISTSFCLNKQNCMRFEFNDTLHLLVRKRRMTN